MTDDYLKKSFWNAFGRGLGGRPVPVTHLVGASGVKHRIQAMSLDEDRRRALIVVAEASSRATALARIDLQSVMSGYEVIVARPLAFDLGAFARRLRDVSGASSFDIREWKPALEKFKA